MRKIIERVHHRQGGTYISTRSTFTPHGSVASSSESCYMKNSAAVRGILMKRSQMPHHGVRNRFALHQQLREVPRSEHVAERCCSQQSCRVRIVSNLHHSSEWIAYLRRVPRRKINFSERESFGQTNFRRKSIALFGSGKLISFVRAGESFALFALTR